jgi:FG-GAP repeat protein
MEPWKHMKFELNQPQFTKGENVMKKKIIRITSKIALAIIIAGLAVALPAPRLNVRSSASAQNANKSPNAPSGLQGEDAIRSLKEQGLYDSLQEAVAATRYELRWENAPARGALPPAYHAPNPAQQYDAYFTPIGLSLAPSKAASNGVKSAAASGETDQPAEAPEWRATMRLIGYGYGEGLVTVGDAALEAQGNRIEYRRAGLPLTEWYVNKAAGIEQGFTIETPPGIRSKGERLRLALELTGDLSAELDEGSQAVALKRADGTIALSYSHLYAYDAQRRELPSHMRVIEGRVILEIDEEKAVYPVTIDPTFTQQANLTASDGARNDNFGYSVAIDGDRVVVGAPSNDIQTNSITKADQGSVYVFLRVNGSWSQQAILTASDGEASDYFGYSVAIQWDTIVVGAPYDDIGANTNQGSAYVFVRSGATWTNWIEQPKLLASIPGAYDNFGYSVAIDAQTGGTIAVGAPYDDVTFTDEGSAYVFVRNNGNWVEEDRMVANAPGANDNFGLSVACERFTAGTVVVGAPYDDVSYTNQGSAYVFVRNNGNWNQQAQLLANDAEANDYFGFSVGISSTGNRIAVGAPYDDIVSANDDRGSAYVFLRNTPFWNQHAKLTANVGAIGAAFGWSVAVSGYEVVVGAPFDDIGANTNQGSAYVFVCNGPCGAPAQVTANNGATSDFFGYSVAIKSGAPSTVVAGALYDDIGLISNQGSAYVFVR